MDPADQMAEIKAKSTPYMSANVRQVQGGFVVAGQVSWTDKTTKGVVMAEQAEGVAATADDAVRMVRAYLTSGSFDGGASTGVAEGAQQADPSANNLFAGTTTI